VATLTRTEAPATRRAEAPLADSRRAVRDGAIVTVGGQLERALGVLTALALRWGLDPTRLGVYTGLRLFLDNTNRSSLGVGLGAVQEIPILRAAGREDEARRVADVAHTTNTLTCLAFSAGLVGLAWWWAPSLRGDPLAAEWTWGLVAVAALALVKRYESFLIAVLRAHQEFALTTRLDVVESSVSAVATALGLWLAGFWGLLAAVGVILSAKIAYLHARHPLRFRWAWDWPIALRLMRVGLPILANTAVFGAVLTIDRPLILALDPDGPRAAGLYTVALLGTGWSLDLAGRLALVLYTYFQTHLGRTGDPAAVARRAMLATEAQAPLLAALGAWAYVFAPSALEIVLPRYAAGLPALRPLMPGMVLLGLTWPARQMLIAVGRPYRLCLATLAGLALLAELGAIATVRYGIVGTAWAMSIGSCGVLGLTGAAAFAHGPGGVAWLGHKGRLIAILSWFAAGALVAAHAPIGLPTPAEFAIRGLVLAAWTLPPLWIQGCRYGWGGLLRVRSGP
jgi:O-antigen/teichoic acid export membrane protein